MIANVPLFVLGLLLLWFPRQWMRFGFVVGHHRRRSRKTSEPWNQREPGDPRISFGELSKVRNHVDLLRAIVGGLTIVGGPFMDASLAVADAADRVAARQLLVLQVAILLIGLLIQTIRYERRHLTFYAPIFYIAGLSVCLCGPWGATFAFLLIWAVNPMFGSAQAFLTVYAVLLAVFGYLFGTDSILLVMAAFLICFLPVLLSLLTRRPLVVLARRATNG